MKKKLIALILAVCAAALAPPAFAGEGAAHADADATTISLAAGEQRELAAGRTLQRVAIGDPSVADVLVVRGGGVLLVAKAPGTTDVMLWERGRAQPLVYDVSVTNGAAQALLGDGTPNVRVMNGVTVISGSAASMLAHERAVEVARASAGSAGSARAGAGTGAGAGALASSGKGGEPRWGALAGSPSIIDASSVAGKSVVQVDVRVVEFSRQVMKQIGINLLKQNNGFTFGTFTPGGLKSVTGGGGSPLSITANIPLTSAFNLVVGSAARGLFADLSILEQNNLARVLAQPTLVALSGQSASFLAGGEIPVPAPQGLGTVSIDWKPYGVGLTVTPTVLAPNRIALKVAPEASQLDFTNAITISGVTVPALTTRRADTTVELGDGESFMIGGLIDRETTSNVSKVPFLGDLPVIGAFFKNLNYQQKDKELVIIVTPHLVAPIAKGASLPATPGEQSEQRNGPVWRSFVGGALSSDAAPGFSR